ncbi:MAG: caspase family protein [Isosphaeraceae bacterium]
MIRPTFALAWCAAWLPASLAPAADDPVGAAYNEQAPWMVRVSVDRDDRRYVVGEEVRIFVESEEPGYLYLFNVDGEKNSTLLFPNKFVADNKIAAKVGVAVPGDPRFRIRVGQIGLGEETLLAVVSRRPLDQFKPVALGANGPTPLPWDRVEKMLAEATLGDKDGSRTRGKSLVEARDALRRTDPAAYRDRSKEWAEHSIRFRTGRDRPAPEGKRVGMFVGISKYKGLPDTAQLNYCDRDAERMAESARSVGGFTVCDLLTNEDATWERVDREFRKLRNITDPGDTVLIYWSGHGARDVTPDRDKPYFYYLLTHDPGNRTLTEDELGRYIRDLDGRKVMVIIDACHSGGQVEGAKSPAGLAARGSDPRSQGGRPSQFPDDLMLRARSIGQHDAAVLTACRLDETSIESSRLKAGLLTYYVLEVMDQNPGPMTLHDVYKKAAPLVEDYCTRNRVPKKQTPTFSDQTPRPPATIRP